MDANALFHTYTHTHTYKYVYINIDCLWQDIYSIIPLKMISDI